MILGGGWCQPMSKENLLKASPVPEEHPFDRGSPPADRILGLSEGPGFGERGSLSSRV